MLLVHWAPAVAVAVVVAVPAVPVVAAAAVVIVVVVVRATAAVVIVILVPTREEYGGITVGAGTVECYPKKFTRSLLKGLSE